MTDLQLLRRQALRGPALLVALAAGALLSACGDDPYDAPATPPAAEAEDTVPASATASPQAYVRFAATLPLDDRAQPRRLDGVTAPTSESAEPEPVD